MVKGHPVYYYDPVNFLSAGPPAYLQAIWESFILTMNLYGRGLKILRCSSGGRLVTGRRCCRRALGPWGVKIARENLSMSEERSVELSDGKSNFGLITVRLSKTNFEKRKREIRTALLFNPRFWRPFTDCSLPISCIRFLSVRPQICKRI